MGAAFSRGWGPIVCLACASALVASCGGATPPPERPAPPTSSGSPTPPPEKLSPWRPIDGAPAQVGSAAWVVSAGDEEIRADHGGVRWLIPKEGRGQRADTFDPLLDYITYEASVGLLAITTEKHLLLARRPLDAWRDLGSLPADVEVGSLAAFQGQLSLRHRGGAAVISPGRDLQPLASLGDRSPYDARIGADGRGIGLFLPEAVGLTTDNGKSWTPLDDTSVHVSALHTRGPTVVLTPGGANDEFPRAWQPGTASLVRTLATPMTQHAPQGVRPSAVLDRHRGAAPNIGASGTEHKAERYPWLDGVVSGRSPIEGNAVGVTAKGWYGLRELGGVTRWYDIPGDNCAVARCGKTHAFACGRSLYVIRDLNAMDRVESVVLTHDARSVAFAGPKVVVVVGSKGMTWVDTSGPATAQDHAVKSDQLTYSDRVVGSCEGPDAGAWLVQAGKLFRFKAGGELSPHDAATFVSPQRYLGLDERSRPVFLSKADADGDVAPALGGFDVEGKWREIVLPFEPREFRTAEVLTRLEGLREGRGLLFDTDSRPWVTTDGGLHWVVVAAPPWAPAIDKRRVVCGATRCEIENTAVYAGWEADSAEVAAVDPMAGTGSTPPAAASTPIAALTCTLGETVDTRKLTPVDLSFGVAGADYTATLLTPMPEEMFGEGSPEQTELAALHLGPTGKGTQRRLALLREPLSALYGFHPTADVQDGLLAFIPSARGIPPLTVTWDRGPAKPLIRTRWGQGLLNRTSLSIILGAEDGVAMMDQLTSTLLWIRADGKQEKRPWPTQWLDLETGWDAAGYGAWIVDRPDGTWLSATHTEGTLELVEIAKDGLSRYRALFTGPGLRIARMISLDGQPVVIGVEDLPDGSSELRARPVTASLSLGAARTLGVFDPRTSRLGLPACDGDATGRSVVVPFGKAAVALGAGSGGGELSQQVRVTATSACLSGERVAGEGFGVVRRLPGQGAVVMHEKVLRRATCAPSGK